MCIVYSAWYMERNGLWNFLYKLYILSWWFWAIQHADCSACCRPFGRVLGMKAMLLSWGPVCMFMLVQISHNCGNKAWLGPFFSHAPQLISLTDSRSDLDTFTRTYVCTSEYSLQMYFYTVSTVYVLFLLYCRLQRQWGHNPFIFRKEVSEKRTEGERVDTVHKRIGKWGKQREREWIMEGG